MALIKHYFPAQLWSGHFAGKQQQLHFKVEQCFLQHHKRQSSQNTGSIVLKVLFNSVEVIRIQCLKDIWIPKLCLVVNGTHHSLLLSAHTHLVHLCSANLKQSYFHVNSWSIRVFWKCPMFVGLFPLIWVDHTSFCPLPGPLGVSILTLTLT